MMAVESILYFQFLFGLMKIGSVSSFRKSIIIAICKLSTTTASFVDTESGVYVPIAIVIRPRTCLFFEKTVSLVFEGYMTDRLLTFVNLVFPNCSFVQSGVLT